MTVLLSGNERYQFFEKSDITVPVNWTNTNNYTNTTSLVGICYPQQLGAKFFSAHDALWLLTNSGSHAISCDNSVFEPYSYFFCF